MNIKPLLLSVVLASMPLTVFAEVVNINQASKAALQHYLKGIGKKKAESIVIYRNEHKGFKSLDEIMEVKGIGKGIYKKIKKDLSLTEGKVAFIKSDKMPKKVKVKMKKKAENVVSDTAVDIKPVEASSDVLKKTLKVEKADVEKQAPQSVVEKKDIE